MTEHACTKNSHQFENVKKDSFLCRNHTYCSVGYDGGFVFLAFCRVMVFCFVALINSFQKTVFFFLMVTETSVFLASQLVISQKFT